MNARCKIEGCTAERMGRGLCSKHWKQWAKSNPDIRVKPMSPDVICPSLPGLASDISKKSGISVESVNAFIKILKAQDMIHIGYWEPPTRKGTRWMPVWVMGAGEDAVVTDKHKKNSQRFRARQWYAQDLEKNGKAYHGANVRFDMIDEVFMLLPTVEEVLHVGERSSTNPSEIIGTTTNMAIRNRTNGQTIANCMARLEAQKRAHLLKWAYTCKGWVGIWVKGEGARAIMPSKPPAKIEIDTSDAREDKGFAEQRARTISLARANNTVALTRRAPAQWFSVLGVDIDSASAT